MRCPSCDAENPQAAKLCMECGSALVAVCAACSHCNPPAAKFCMECGSPVVAKAPSPPPLPVEAPGTAPPAPPPLLLAAPAPQSYTPQHLAERILTSRSALEGERKQVTVLFGGSSAVADGQATRRVQRHHNHSPRPRPAGRSTLWGGKASATVGRRAQGSDAGHRGPGGGGPGRHLAPPRAGEGPSPSSGAGDRRCRGRRTPGARTADAARGGIPDGRGTRGALRGRRLPAVKLRGRCRAAALVMARPAWRGRAPSWPRPRSRGAPASPPQRPAPEWEPRRGDRCGRRWRPAAHQGSPIPPKPLPRPSRRPVACTRAAPSEIARTSYGSVRSD